MSDGLDSAYKRLAKTFNSGRARVVLLTGNVHDLFPLDNRWHTLVEYLVQRTSGTKVNIVYELNQPLKIDGKYKDAIRQAWIDWQVRRRKTDFASKEQRQHQESELGKEFDRTIDDTIGHPSVGLQLLQQLAAATESTKYELFVVIEAADLIVPAGRDIAGMNDSDRFRLGVLQDWFCGPKFLESKTCVVLTADSSSLVHERITTLPQVALIEVPLPNEADRTAFACHFLKCEPSNERIGELVPLTAGLTIQALRKVLSSLVYSNDWSTTRVEVTRMVEEQIIKELGPDVVEFYRPQHTLDDVVGNEKLKQYLRLRLTPRFLRGGKKALAAAIAAGPLGAGKTYIAAAWAGELGVPILILKSIRSQWYGGTDILFEKLRRILYTFPKLIVLIDEADAQMPAINEGSHETEKRLTGKTQNVMSDPVLIGRVFWLLMTARIENLSPDVRRSGRGGDLIVPILDPTGQDRQAFIAWTIKDTALKTTEEIDAVTRSYSAADFAKLRRELEAEAMILDRELTPEEVIAVARDIIPSNISHTRERQTLEALVNCTKRSLLPEEFEGLRLDDDEAFEKAKADWQSRLERL